MKMYVLVSALLLLVFQSVVNSQASCPSSFPRAGQTPINFTETSDCPVCFEHCLKPIVQIPLGRDAYATCRVPTSTDGRIDRAFISYYVETSCFEFRTETFDDWHHFDEHIHFRKNEESVEILIVNAMEMHSNITIVCSSTNVANEDTSCAINSTATVLLVSTNGSMRADPTSMISVTTCNADLFRTALAVVTGICLVIIIGLFSISFVLYHKQKNLKKAKYILEENVKQTRSNFTDSLNREVGNGRGTKTETNVAAVTESSLALNNLSNRRYSQSNSSDSVKSEVGNGKGTKTETNVAAVTESSLALNNLSNRIRRHSQSNSLDSVKSKVGIGRGTKTETESIMAAVAEHDLSQEVDDI